MVRFVVLGGGVAGVTCAEELARLALPTDEIFLISQSRILKIVANVKLISKTTETFDMLPTDLDDYRQNTKPRFHVLQGTVASIDRKQKVVTTATGHLYPYDKLCIAAGARPKLLFKEQPNVLGIRDLESVEVLCKRLSHARRVMVVGNGGIALELLNEIRRIPVVWAIKDNYLGNTFLDVNASTFFMPHLYTKNEPTFAKIINPYNELSLRAQSQTQDLSSSSAMRRASGGETVFARLPASSEAAEDSADEAADALPSLLAPARQFHHDRSDPSHEHDPVVDDSTSALAFAVKHQRTPHISAPVALGSTLPATSAPSARRHSYNSDRGESPSSTPEPDASEDNVDTLTQSPSADSLPRKYRIHPQHEEYRQKLLGSAPGAALGPVWKTSLVLPPPSERLSSRYSDRDLIIETECTVSRLWSGEEWAASSKHRLSTKPHAGAPGSSATNEDWIEVSSAPTSSSSSSDHSTALASTAAAAHDSHSVPLSGVRFVPERSLFGEGRLGLVAIEHNNGDVSADAPGSPSSAGPSLARDKLKGVDVELLARLQQDARSGSAIEVDDAETVAKLLTSMPTLPEAGYVANQGMTNGGQRGVLWGKLQKDPPANGSPPTPVLDEVSETAAKHQPLPAHSPPSSPSSPTLPASPSAAAATATPHDPASPSTEATGNETLADDRPSKWPLYVLLSNNKIYGVDFMISATGVTPNCSLAESAGLSLSPVDNGILVDKTMRSHSDPDVFAAGDCVHCDWPDKSKHWFQMRLWSQARLMGLQAARAMVRDVIASYYGNDTRHLSPTTTAPPSASTTSSSSPSSAATPAPEQCLASPERPLPPLLDIHFDLFAHVSRFFGFKVVLLGLFNAQGLKPGDFDVMVRSSHPNEYVKVIKDKENKLRGAMLIGETDLEEMFENLIISESDVSFFEDVVMKPDIELDQPLFDDFEF
ncbi:Pyridine nucleotide-disulfide oxidoreductase domain-containing protein 1 [Sorochytrium milnesiophthora]